MELKVIWNVEGKDKKLIGAVLGSHPFTFTSMTDGVQCATHLYLGEYVISASLLFHEVNKRLQIHTLL